MSVTKSNQNNLTSPNGNSLAVFVDINDNALKLKDINGGVEPITNYTGSSSVGLLQLQGGVALSSTLTSVTDQNNTASPLKLSTTSAQFVSPLRISTDDASGFYLDCEDSSTNNRFSIKRDPASQLVTLDFASNPIGSTTSVGAIRTYVDGTNLSEVMTFREDGNVGIGTTTPTTKLVVNSTATALNATFDALSTATILGGQQSPLRVLRTGGQPNVYIGTSNETPDHSGFLAGIRTGAWYNTSSPTYSGQFNAYAINRYNSWGAQTSAANLRMSQSFTCNGNTGRQALLISPLSAESATNSDYVAVNNLLVTTAEFFGTQPTARVQIVGDGSTSATTSLLVQNYSGTNLLKIADDGNVGIGTTAPVGILHLYKSAAATRLVMDGDAGQSKIITYRTGGLQRFGLYVNNTAESGSNAGSNFAIRAYSDAGTLLSTPLFIERSTGNVGIGTTAPISPLNVYNSSASVSNLLLLEQDTSAVLGQIINYRKNGSVNLTSGTELGRLAFGGYFNSTYSPPSQTCSAITAYYGGTGTDRVGGLRLTTWNGGGATTRLQVAPDGKIGIGTTGASAKVQIVGEGSTSATTSFLVQNSGGNEALKVTDDRSVTISGGTTTISSPKTFINGISTTTSGFGDTGYGMAIDGGIRFGVGGGESYQFGYWYAISQASNWVNSSKSTIIVGQGATTPNINNITWTSVDITPTFDVNFIGRVGNIIRGIYYNPTITSFVNGVSNQLRAFQSVVGGVFINTSNVEASAILQADSTTQGFLPPRMTTAQKVTLAATATAGLMIYDTDLNKLCVYTGAGWETITSV